MLFKSLLHDLFFPNLAASAKVLPEGRGKKFKVTLLSLFMFKYPFIQIDPKPAVPQGPKQKDQLRNVVSLLWIYINMFLEKIRNGAHNIINLIEIIST